MRAPIAFSLIVLAGLAISGCSCVTSPCGDPALGPMESNTPAPQIDLWGTVAPTPSPTPAQGFVAVSEVREPGEPELCAIVLGADGQPIPDVLVLVKLFDSQGLLQWMLVTRQDGTSDCAHPIEAGRQYTVQAGRGPEDKSPLYAIEGSDTERVTVTFQEVAR